MKNPRVIATVVGLIWVLTLIAGWAYLSRDSGTDAALIPFLSSQVKVRDAMVMGLRTYDLDAFCEAYLEFKKIAKEEPLLLDVQPEKGGKDYWTVLLLVTDSQLIRTFADLNGLCEAYCPY